MPLWHTRDPLILLARARPRPRDDLLLPRVVASAVGVAKSRLALVVAATARAQTGVGCRARRAHAPRTVGVCVAVRRGLAWVAAALGREADWGYAASVGLLG